VAFWESGGIRLRSYEPADEAAFRAWSRDSARDRCLENVEAPRGQDQLERWVAAKARLTFENGDYPFFIEKLDGTPVGSLTTFECNPRTGVFSYGLDIALEHRRQGYARTAITIVLRYYFEECRYQKANVRVHADNAPAIALHEQLGFSLEGRLRRNVFTGGVHLDELCFGITAEEFHARCGGQ
jgi:RimJ/RimL family protein N-acetyltransferase